MDHFTNTVEDAAAYEARHGVGDGDRPTFAEAQADAVSDLPFDGAAWLLFPIAPMEDGEVPF
jgi:hypothetical protein